jgi:hypothetical protein
MWAQYTYYNGPFYNIWSPLIILYTLGVIGFYATSFLDFTPTDSRIFGILLWWTLSKPILAVFSILLLVFNIVSTLLFGAITLLSAVTLGGSLAMILFFVSELIRANERLGFGSIANDDLFCCVFYSSVSQCTETGPCVPAKSHDDLMVNREFWMIFGWSIVLLFIEACILITSFATYKERKIIDYYTRKAFEEDYGFSIDWTDPWIRFAPRLTNPDFFAGNEVNPKMNSDDNNNNSLSRRPYIVDTKISSNIYQNKNLSFQNDLMTTEVNTKKESIPGKIKRHVITALNSISIYNIWDNFKQMTDDLISGVRISVLKDDPAFMKICNIKLRKMRKERGLVGMRDSSNIKIKRSTRGTSQKSGLRRQKAEDLYVNTGSRNDKLHNRKKSIFNDHGTSEKGHRHQNNNDTLDISPNVGCSMVTGREKKKKCNPLGGRSSPSLILDGWNQSKMQNGINDHDNTLSNPPDKLGSKIVDDWSGR